MSIVFSSNDIYIQSGTTKRAADLAGIYWNYGGSKIYDNGNLTIETDDLIQINNGLNITTGRTYSYSVDFGGYKWSTSGYVPFGSGDISGPWAIVANGGMLTTNGGGFWASSDIRSKTNIDEIQPYDALNTLRQITPKKYNFIDNINKTEQGFIAQEIIKIVPDCVSKRTEYIPNIYDFAKITDKNTITLTNKLTTNFILNENIPTKIKLVDKSGKDVKANLTKIIDNNTFAIDKEIEENDIFVYGQEVDDFHVLEKNTIYTITTAAVKQLDIELQETKNIVNKQQNEINTLKEELQKLKDFIYK